MANTSSTLTLYTGYYTGGTPVVANPQPFDVAKDLSTGNLWQYTGAAWVAPSWQTSITVWLGGATTVCERLRSPDTKIPDTVTVYYGTDDNVPPELALSAEDLAIKHDIGNYNLVVNVMRQDVTTNTMVDVPFPEGYIASTDDGDWTILKNFTQCVGYDYAMVSLAWTTTADGTGPQSVDYITSDEAEILISSAIGSGGDLSNYVTSSGASVIASNIAVTTLLSGGQAVVGGVSAIELWFESGYREHIYADFVMSSKSLTLVSSGGSFVYRPDNYLWVSAVIDGYGDISNTLNAPEVSAGFFASSSGGVIVVSAVEVTETFLEGPTDSPVVDGLIASSIDGGRTWTFGEAGIYWGTNGEEEVDGEGWCYPVWGIGSCCRVELQRATISASGALLSNTELETAVGSTSLSLTSSGGFTLNAEAVATQPWVTSQLADITPASGAIISGAAFETTVGDVSLTLGSGSFRAELRDTGLFRVADDGIQISANIDKDTASVNVAGYTIALTASQVLSLNADRDINVSGNAVNINGATVSINSAYVATEPWVQSQIATAGHISTEIGQRIATNTAIDIIRAGGTGYSMPAIDVWYESGYIDYIEYAPSTYIGSKNITLVSSGGSYIHAFDNEVWASDGENVVRITQGSMTCTSEGSALVISADMEVYTNDTSDPYQQVVASSVDGGLSWDLVPGEALEWFASGYELTDSGAGSCISCIAQYMQSGAVVSGALLSNTELHTIVGGYTVALTAGGGLVVSGSGASVVFSGGEIVARVDESVEEDLHLAELKIQGGSSVILRNANGGVTLDEDGISANFGDVPGARVYINSDGVVMESTDGGPSATAAKVAPDGFSVNSLPVLTQLATSTNTETTSAAIPILSGGTSYVYTQPLTILTVASVANTTAEDRLQFTLASGGSVTIPASCGVCPSGFTFEGGKSYLVAVMGGNVIAAEYAPGV